MLARRPPAAPPAPGRPVVQTFGVGKGAVRQPGVRGPGLWPAAVLGLGVGPPGLWPAAEGMLRVRTLESERELALCN